MSGKRRDRCRSTGIIPRSKFRRALPAMIEEASDHRSIQVEDFDLFSMAFSSAAIGMALVATDGRFLNVNDAMCRITGYSRSELLTRDFQAITHPEDLDADVDYARQLLAGERNSYQMEKRYVRKDGSIAWVLLTGSLARKPSGEPRVFIAQVQDIAALKQAESELTSFFVLCRDLLAIASPEGVLVRVNPAWQAVLGWRAGELEGIRVADLLHPDDVERTAVEFQRIATLGAGDSSWINRYRHKDGSYRWLEWTTSLRPDGCFLGVARDITEQRMNDEKILRQSRQLEETNRELSRALADLQQANRELGAVRQELEYLAWYDSLTGLGNRNLFLSQLEHILAVSAWKKEEFALLFLDLNGFKAINDSLGHAAGDAALQEVAGRLQRALHKADRSCRLGGDEFAALLVPTTEDVRDAAKAAADKITSALEPPVRLNGGEHHIRASIGIALFPHHGQDVETLLRKADTAMYEAKIGARSVSIAPDPGATTVFSNPATRLEQT